METAVDSAWLPAPEDLSLTSDEVHAWQASLDWSAGEVLSFQHLLAPDELDRAARFNFDRDRQRFVAAHGLLRTILGRYLDLSPDQLQFAYNKHGKPALIGSSPPGTLNFNLSHADDLLLIAITRDRDIGIDVEYLHPLPDLQQIAECFFANPEKETLQALPPAMRNEIFFRLWTCKEAYIKARGDGLSLRLDRFHITLSPGRPGAWLHVPGNPGEAARWSLHELMPTHRGYVAALAVEGKGWRLTRRDVLSQPAEW